ncbi:RNA-binding protein FUS-like [Limulus polyphemus]|uniref:RNA-binding protein FUS-like n=1 Tax=Limulus polyphemus TaxID=6850 RepID=A0ABM1S9V7_LIMPO|nr:RNA-binding protein FUS-like [Limulus polyphemus]
MVSSVQSGVNGKTNKTLSFVKIAFTALLLYVSPWVEGFGRQQGYGQQQQQSFFSQQQKPFGQQQQSFGQQNGYQQSGSVGSQNNFGPPQPFDFNYEAKDEFGNSHYRQEQGDQNGNVYGSYGYTDANGLFRYVEYSSGPGGFNAKIHTNEPGTKADNPADVVLNVEQPPAGIQDQYTRRTQSGGYQNTQQQQSYGGQYQTGGGSRGFSGFTGSRGRFNSQHSGGSRGSGVKHAGYA